MLWRRLVAFFEEKEIILINKIAKHKDTKKKYCKQRYSHFSFGYSKQIPTLDDLKSYICGDKDHVAIAGTGGSKIIQYSRLFNL